MGSAVAAVSMLAATSASGRIAAGAEGRGPGTHGMTRAPADDPVKADDHGVDALRYGINTTRALWQQRIPLAA